MPYSTHYMPVHMKTREIMCNLNHNRTDHGDSIMGTGMKADGVSLTNSGQDSWETSQNYINLYTIVRLSELRQWNASTVFKILNQDVGDVPNVPCIQELNDGSWELIVRQRFIPHLQEKLLHLFPGCHLDLSYDPFEPSMDEVERLGYVRAKYCSLHALSSRATAMVKEAWPVAAEYYQYLLDTMA